ncbi:MAG: hypothetical protein H6557_33455 [Lewinellaceae bacterium]|nr:hypothetical protein [Phaeodactylibacter sp.]MCB9041550.1 hypothetical protein [Lewinellaceae bacterium]
MSRLAHRIYIATLVSIVAMTAVFLAYSGMSYYSTSMEERFYHPGYSYFKPSGIYGHGLGIVGTLLILIGVASYIARKRYGFLSGFGRLKYWLEFHIFLCSLGPVMILFHTAFKFGGIVSVAFWSMVAVVLSGVIGRFIYIQIPRTIQGRALSLNEVKEMKKNLEDILKNSYQLDGSSLARITESARVQTHSSGNNLLAGIARKYFEDKKTIRSIKKDLRAEKLPLKDVREVTKLVKNEMSLNNRIERLHIMQQLFKYWHVAHLPFAIIMLVIVLIHVGITLAFGYKWVF